MIREQRAVCSNCVDPSVQTAIRSICPSGVQNEGYLKSVNYDDMCIPPERTAGSYFEPDRCFEKDDDWAYCNNKKIVSLKNNKCLEYFDRGWWVPGGDSVNVEPCRNRKSQQFEKQNQRKTRVRTTFSSSGSKSERFEFGLKSVTGNDNCVKSD